MRILVFSKICREVENLRSFEWAKFVEDRDLSFAPRIWSPDDEGALEAALDLKEALSKAGTELELEAVLLCEEDNSAADFVRQLYAVGINQVTLLKTQTESLAITDTAEIFKTYLESSQADLLLFGQSALPRDLGLTAGAVAAALGLPLTTGVEAFDLAHKVEAGLRVLRRNGAVQEALELSLPHVLALKDYSPYLRVATLMEKMRAKHKIAQEIAVERVSLTGMRLEAYRHEALLRDGRKQPFENLEAARLALRELNFLENIKAAEATVEENSEAEDERWSESFFQAAKAHSYKPYFLDLHPGLLDFQAILEALKAIPDLKNCCFFLPPRETAQGIAGYLARSSSGLALTQVTEISFQDSIYVERMAYAHNLHESLRLEAGHGPYFFVLEKGFESSASEVAARLFETKAYFKNDLNEASIYSQQPLEASSGIANKAVVVVAGRGVSEADISRLRELAAARGWGFTASRALVHQGLAVKEEMLGISGLSLAPQLALLLGVSGATPLMWGIKDAKMLVSVNENMEALVNRQADLALIGDSADFIEALIAEFADMKEK
ncbi:MAG: FAD-binding protein [Eubacteriales bacterium]|nr:FAD-binding protein [Eubacteriales bacterium]